MSPIDAVVMDRVWHSKLRVLASKRPRPGPKPQRAHAALRARLAVLAGAVHPASRDRSVPHNVLAVLTVDSDRAISLDRNCELTGDDRSPLRGNAAPHRLAAEQP